jgi:hypothetical protein
MSPPSETGTPTGNPPTTAPAGLSSETHLFSEQDTTVHLIGPPSTVVLAHDSHYITTPLTELASLLEHFEVALDHVRAESPWTDADSHKRAALRHQRDCLVIATYAIEAAREQDHHHYGRSLSYRRVSALRDDAQTIINHADDLLAQQTAETSHQHSFLTRVRTIIDQYQ